MRGRGLEVSLDIVISKDRGRRRHLMDETIELRDEVVCLAFDDRTKDLHVCDRHIADVEQ